FIVREQSTENQIDWGAVNQPISEEAFEKLYAKVVSYLKQRDELFVFEGFAGADEKYRLPITVVNEFAWHNLFARQLFIRPETDERDRQAQPFTI
ncbi:phosphoenolpyruvate carboxykinase (ATP), partial [Bacillus tropicus]